MKEIIIHTDGGCSGNPGPGAWAYVMRYGDRLREDSGFEADTTNNKMELRAVIEALSYLLWRKIQVNGALETRSARARPAKAEPVKAPPLWLSSPISVYTDSLYVKNGVTAWLPSWKARGWKTADKKPVKNQSLWAELDALAQELRPTFHWVEGHTGVEDNERCDALVGAAIKAGA